MHWQHISEFKDRTIADNEPARPGKPAGFLVVPWPGASSGPLELSLVEALYRCAFQRARAELQSPPAGRDLFAVCN
jgi:hypothetical protein